MASGPPGDGSTRGLPFKKSSSNPLFGSSTPRLESGWYGRRGGDYQHEGAGPSDQHPCGYCRFRGRQQLECCWLCIRLAATDWGCPQPTGRWCSTPAHQSDRLVLMFLTSFFCLCWLLLFDMPRVTGLWWPNTVLIFVLLSFICL